MTAESRGEKGERIKTEYASRMTPVWDSTGRDKERKEGFKKKIQAELESASRTELANTKPEDSFLETQSSTKRRSRERERK